MERVEGMKWLGTALILSGILFTNLNIYPINIFLHGTGVVFWSIAGYITQDKPVLANFGLQIPLFVIGFSKLWFDL
tara:strand:+ start:3598 stop:3825 length:228 start_codon:yes stop_codon:yes gene_type:complete